MSLPTFLPEKFLLQGNVQPDYQNDQMINLKAAKDFTAAERGANKFAHSRRKVFWDVVSSLVRSGFTSDTAIDKVYSVYVIYDMPPAKRHATTISPLSIPLGAPEPPVNSPVIPPAQSPVKSPATTPAKSSARTPAQSPAKTPAQSPAKTPAKSPATTPAKSPAKTPAKAPAKSPRKTPTKSAEKTSAKSPTNTPAKSPAKSPAQAPAKGQTPRKKRARKEVAASPIPSLRPLRSCTVRVAEVDISVGDDRFSSGDEDDF
ncbi:hypothetical protein PInf_008053 [Phytophthora infestans]|nr:hypothetical protein PInf_008040 [Phytophthora infestans]KAI9982162.1 hypothetical protein PInf_008053 [Phytophthora infestans]